MPTIGTRCGDGKLPGDGEAEYPCVRRFRQRRLITLLWLQGFKSTTESMLNESDAIFNAVRLRQLVVRDQWHDALHYLSRFLPPLDTKPQLSVEAMVLRLFIGAHRSLANIVAGRKESPIYSQYLSHDRNVCHGVIRLRSIMLNKLYSRPQVRVSIDWERVRLKAAEIIHGLAHRTPELKDLLFMPGGPMKPHNVLPIGFGFRRRYPLKKQARQARSYALACHYLGKRRSLPAMSGPSQETYDELLTESKAMDWVADIVDECLKAGKRPESHQVHPLKISAKEGATVAPVLHTVFSGLTCPAMNPGTPSVANEVTNAGSKLASRVPTNSAPFLGTMHAPVSQTAFGCLTSHCGNSDAGLMEYAGAPAAPVSQTMNLTSHAENFGVTIAAPVSQTMFGSLACPAINPRMPSTAIEGKLASHVSTPGAPFLGTMGAPVSQAVFGSITSHCENSGVALMAKAGAPVAPVSQTMNLTSHDGNTGALVAPVSQNMFGTLTGPAETAGMPLLANAGQSAGLALTPDAPVSLTGVAFLTSTAKNPGFSLMTNNSGAPFAPAVQTTNLASHAEKSVHLGYELSKPC